MSVRRCLSLCLVVAATGCAKPYLKVNPVVDAATPLPALMVSSAVRSVPKNANKESLVQAVTDIAVQAAMNSMLDDFGGQVRASTEPLLIEQGFALRTDPMRAKDVRKKDWTKTANSLTVVTGSWSDPDGALFFLTPKTLFRRKIQAKVGDALGTGESEAFVFSTVEIERRVSWLLLRRPRVELQLVAMDQDGTDLLLARSRGFGKRKFLVCDRGPVNLQIGLDEALSVMGSLEPEVLIPKEAK